MFTEKVSVNYRGFQPNVHVESIVSSLCQEIVLEGPSLLKLKARRIAI